MLTVSARLPPAARQGDQGDGQLGQVRAVSDGMTALRLWGMQSREREALPAAATAR